MIVSMAYPMVYVQEPGILKQSAEWFTKYGKKLFVIAGQTAWQKAGAGIEQSLRQSGTDYTLCLFNGTCSYAEVDRIQNEICEGTDLIVAVGGGQCMDTAKLVANRAGLPIATVSTLASTCASTTPLSIMYDEEHTFVGIEYFSSSPVLTLVDTDVIAAAPYRYLVAGIGDTLAKWYEAYPMNAGKFQNARTRMGLKTAELAKDILLEFSEQAIAENKAGISGEAIKQIVDANILLAGLVGGIGHYTCRGSGAHSFHNGLTSIPEIHEAFHGEIVAFGILCQLVLEQKDVQEVERLMKYYLKFELPVSLFDLHLTEIRDGEIRQSARRACDPKENIHYLPFPVSEDAAFMAIKTAHEIGERVKKEHQAG